jgi:mono/diheme cytochrome c family protein
VLLQRSCAPAIDARIEDVTALSIRFFQLTFILIVLCSFAASSVSAFALDRKAVAGATLFRDKGCAYCHGANTQGTQKGPSLALVRKAMKAAQISAQIENGGQKMPSFSDSLSHDEVAQLVAFLRAKHRPAPSPVAEPAKSPAAVSNPGQ